MFASINNNNVLSEDVKMTESLFLLGKCLFFVVAYINMINDTRNLTLRQKLSEYLTNYFVWMKINTSMSNSVSKKKSVIAILFQGSHAFGMVYFRFITLLCKLKRLNYYLLIKC